MKVLLTDYYPLGFGGAEMNTYMIARALREKGIEPIIASTGDYKGLEVRKFRPYPLPMLFFQKTGLKDFLKKIIETENIELVHAMDRLTSVAAVEAAAETGKKAAVHFNDYWFLCPRSSCLRPDGSECRECSYSGLFSCMPLWRIPWEAYKLWAIKSAQKTLGRADAYFAVSRLVEERLSLAGIKENITIAPNFIEPEKFSNAEPDREILEITGVKVGFVGRLSYEKGMATLIGIMKKVLGKRKDIVFVIAGEGSYRERIEKTVKENGFEGNVKILGNVGFEKMPSIYRAIDILLVPSLWSEPFGRITIEAMAAGKTVIASDKGFFRELISDGENGFLAEPGNAGEWATKIEMLADDSKLRERTGLKGFETGKAYGRDAVISRLIATYKRVLPNPILMKKHCKTSSSQGNKLSAEHGAENMGKPTAGRMK